MNSVLFEASVLPLYGQVVIQDVGAKDIPDWETGEERAVATERSILVATRPDTEGDVTIRVVRDGSSEGGESVFDGQLTLTGTEPEVGNSITGSLYRVDIGQTGPLVSRRAIARFVDDRYSAGDGWTVSQLLTPQGDVGLPFEAVYGLRFTITYPGGSLAGGSKVVVACSSGLVSRWVGPAFGRTHG